MYFPVIGWSVDDLGFRTESDSIILYSPHVYSGFLGMCVSCIVDMRIFRRSNCCAMADCSSVVVKWHVFKLTTEIAISPIWRFITVGIFPLE